MLVNCDCPNAGVYDDDEYSSCYSCYLERRSNYESCIFCGRWHSPKFQVCYECRRTAGRDEAGRDLRLEILARDAFTCRYCGKQEGDMQMDPRKVADDVLAGIGGPFRGIPGERPVSLHVDHIMPCAKGGRADPWNLQVLCGVCNVAKGDTWWLGSRHHDARQEIAHAYLTYLWVYLTREEKDRLLIDQGLDELLGRV